MKKVVLLTMVLLAATWLHAGDKDKPAAKLENKVADSGSFGIYVDGKRIGTETFKIEQRPDFSIATSEIKVDDGTSKATQTSEMQVAPNGELHSYIWHGVVPVKEESTVEPKEDMLTEHIVDADLKRHNVPHLLPLSTAILDDNFFSHREILLWRYLAACKVENKQRLCAPSQFGILVPRQHQAENVTMELAGMEKITVKGVIRELNKVILKVADPQQLVVMNQKESEPGQWVLWVDENYKVIKITVSGTNIEAVRD